jgi:hypothetical protein
MTYLLKSRTHGRRPDSVVLQRATGKQVAKRPTVPRAGGENVS